MLPGMTRSMLRIALAALLAVLIAGSYSAPSANAAGLRAAKCCTEHCAKPRSPAAAKECCPSFDSPGDVGAFTVAAKAPSLDPGSAVLSAVAAEQWRPAEAPSGLMLGDTSPRAAPLFLRTLSLRL